MSEKTVMFKIEIEVPKDDIKSFPELATNVLLNEYKEFVSNKKEFKRMEDINNFIDKEKVRVRTLLDQLKTELEQKYIKDKLRDFKVSE